jgi:hypothetical protein
LGLFYKVPPLVFNFQETENLMFLYFDVSGTFLDLNLIGDFYSINILSREAAGEIAANERSHEAQKSLGGTAH